ncbi:hypothetical protein Tco_0168649 [Tanacetum coccineum]
MILSGADNRPPMLEKDWYDSWKSQMELYMQNREHGRMILESVEHGPLIWPTVEENGVIRTKKYAAEKIQSDCDMKATNIVLQGLLVDIYSLDSSGFPTTNNQTSNFLKSKKPSHYSRWTRLPCNNFREKSKIILVLHIRAMLLVQGEILQVDRQELLNATTAKVKEIWLEAQEAGKILDEEQLTEDLDTYDSDCDDLSTALAVLMANISNYGSDVILEVPNSETYLNDIDNQSVHALQDFEQSLVMDFTDNEISIDAIFIHKLNICKKHNRQLFKILIYKHNKIQ